MNERADNAEKHGPSSGDDQARRVGARLRKARIDQGLSLADVAAIAGLSRSFLSKAERGLSSASLNSLLHWTKALQISVASLFEVAPERADRRLRSPAFQAEGVIDYLLTPAGETRFEVFEEHLEPGRAPDPRYWSVNADYAYVYIVCGTLEITFDHGERGVELQTGDLHVYEPREPHRWTNTGPGRAVLLIFDAPPAF